MAKTENKNVAGARLPFDVRDRLINDSHSENPGVKEAAIKKLLESDDALIVSVADRWFNNHNYKISKDELYVDAKYAYVMSLEKFDFTKGKAFFAWVRNGIYKGLTEEKRGTYAEMGLSKHRQTLEAKFYKTREMIIMETGEDPSSDKILRTAGISKKSWDNICSVRDILNTASCEGSLDPHGTDPYKDGFTYNPVVVRNFCVFDNEMTFNEYVLAENMKKLSDLELQWYRDIQEARTEKDEPDMQKLGEMWHCCEKTVTNRMKGIYRTLADGLVRVLPEAA